MNIQGLLQNLDFEIKQAGSQLQVDCPECGDTKKHLYIRPDTGVGYCQKCTWSPNPYKLIEKVTTKSPAEIMRMLEEFGLNDSDKGSGDKTESPKRKPLAISKNEIRSLTADEKKRFCELKQINVAAFEKFQPYAHTKEPWVLLPAFEPGDQSRACGWLRCGIEGQDIRLADGRMEKYPAVAGSRHGLFGLPWLTREKPDTIVFCEAWRDALAAISLGLFATASSGGASKWSDEWLPVFEGRTVYICMDCDVAGQRAGERAARAISSVAKEVFIVNLPYEIQESHGKDLHDYITEKGRDFLLLLSKAKRYEPGVEDTCQGQILLDNSHALTIARAIRDGFRQDDRILRHYNYQGTWCEYMATGYAIREYIDMQNTVWRFASRCLLPGRGEDAVPVPLNCTEQVIKNALSAMGSFEGVDIRSSIVAPAWLDGKRGPDPEYVVALKNGLLDVSGEPVLIEHTPDFLNFNILPYDYDAGAECPEWIAFLGEVFGREGLSSTETRWDEEKSDFVEVEETVPDSEKIECLQEWFGLLLTTEMKYHKMLGIIGPKRSGKGTIGRVLTSLIGNNNVATPTFASLVESFGLQGLLNARVAIFGDANMDKDPVVVSRAVEKLKTISGEDGVDVNCKYEKVIQGARLKVRFVMISNNLQRLTDPTGTISDRFIFLKTTQSFYGREDLGLETRLLGELAGILNWAIDGLKRLKERGHILEPQESIEMRTQSKELGSNVIAFVNSACNKGKGLYSMPDDMYDAFKRWCEADGSKPMKKRAFRQEFSEAFGEHACGKHRIAGYDNPMWVYWEVEPNAVLTY